VLKLLSIEKDLQSRAMLGVAVVELKRRATPGHEEVGRLAKAMARQNGGTGAACASKGEAMLT